MPQTSLVGFRRTKISIRVLLFAASPHSIHLHRARAPARRRGAPLRRVQGGGRHADGQALRHRDQLRAARRQEGAGHHAPRLFPPPHSGRAEPAVQRRMGGAGHRACAQATLAAVRLAPRRTDGRRRSPANRRRGRVVSEDA